MATRPEKVLDASQLEILRAVEACPLAVVQTLRQLGIPRSTYYRWRARFRHRGQAGLHDRPSSRHRFWNRILPDERDRVLEIALLYPEWSPREISCHITDECGFTISESSVYRILKAEAGRRKAGLPTRPLRNWSSAFHTQLPVSSGRQTPLTCW